jgi:ATP-dependent Clp protease adaptor protein ClpS
MARHPLPPGPGNPVPAESVSAGSVAPPGRPVAVTASTAPQVDERTDTDTVVDPSRPWDVIVWDDPINLMSYVVWVFKRVFHFTEPVARKLMLEVHEQGKALVASEPREQAELYLQQLHGYGLQATIQRAS